MSKRVVMLLFSNETVNCNVKKAKGIKLPDNDFSKFSYLSLTFSVKDDLVLFIYVAGISVYFKSLLYIFKQNN